MAYTAQTFAIPELQGISKKQLDVHLKLYEGYVKHVNLIQDTIQKLREEDKEKNAFTINELRRRLGFEFDGMRMHEYYFEQLVGGPQTLGTPSSFARAAADRYGGWDGFIAHIKEVAGTRGIGWVITYYDKVSGRLETAFVGDHELGQLAGLPIIFALDLWEHAFMVDYVPVEKGTYVDSFLINVNWEIPGERYENAR